MAFGEPELGILEYVRFYFWFVCSNYFDCKLKFLLVILWRFWKFKINIVLRHLELLYNLWFFYAVKYRHLIPRCPIVLTAICTIICCWIRLLLHRVSILSQNLAYFLPTSFRLRRQHSQRQYRVNWLLYLNIRLPTFILALLQFRMCWLHPFKYICLTLIFSWCLRVSGTW